jgi:hypothetical protein
MSRRPNNPLAIDPVWLLIEPLVDKEGDFAPLSSWLPAEEAVFRLACGVISGSFSISMASWEELEEWLDLEVT